MTTFLAIISSFAAGVFATILLASPSTPTTERLFKNVHGASNDKSGLDFTKANYVLSPQKRKEIGSEGAEKDEGLGQNGAWEPLDHSKDPFRLVSTCVYRLEIGETTLQACTWDVFSVFLFLFFVCC